MDHKKRIRATLIGEKTDRMPVSSWGHDFLREWSAEELAQHTVERQRKFDYDLVKLNPRWTMFAEPWGNQYCRPTTQEFPKNTHKMIHSAEDLSRIERVGVDHPVFQEYERALELVLNDIGDDVDVVATIFSPLGVAGLLCGGVGEPLLSFAKSNPQDLEQLLSHITDTLQALTERVLKLGASGIFYAPLQWTSLNVCDEPFYEQFGRPYDLQVLKAAEGAELNMMHMCGNNIGVERFLDYPVQVLNWDNFGKGNPTLQEVHAKTDKVVSGGVPHMKLHKLSEQELEELTQEAVAGLGDRMILTSGCAVGAGIGDKIRLDIAHLPDRLTVG
jgi:uroporphyrinogen decarboxylase